MRDPLTGAFNRRYFDDALERETGRCRRTAEAIAVLFADIDRFKRLNDEFGHAFGDQVLQRMARLLGEALRRSDVLARYGGEEFVILAAQPTEKGLEKVAERIRARVEQEPFILDGRRVPVTISLGAALAIPSRNDAELSRRLLAAADEAMYDSKRNGRNQVHLRLLCTEEERRLTQAVVQRRFSRWLVRRSVIDVTNATKALLQCQPLHVRIGILAQQQNWLEPATIEAVLREQERTGDRFGRTAIRLGLLSETQIAQLLALQQEDPITLASLLARTGLIDAERASVLVDAYFVEHVPSCPPAEAPILLLQDPD
jgi:diguanylate cyclase (GGDEF)-like protein